MLDVLHITILTRRSFDPNFLSNVLILHIMVAQSKNFVTIDYINNVDLYMKKISSKILVHLATTDILIFYD